MNGDKLTDNRVVADDGQRIFALEFQVLGDIAHYGIRVDMAVFTDAGATFHYGTAVDACTGTNLDIGIDGDKGTNLNTFP